MKPVKCLEHLNSEPTRNHTNMIKRRRFCFVPHLVILLVLVGVSHRTSAAIVDAGAPNGTNDTPTLQGILNAGNVVSLRTNATYTVKTGLVVKSNNSGIITAGISNPATLYLPTGAFNNDSADYMFEPAHKSNSMVVYAFGVTNLQLKNFTISQTHQDGTWVSAICLRAVTNSLIKDVGISNFSLGTLISLDSVNAVSVRECRIHDSWAGTYLNTSHLPQLTGISIDDNRVGGVGSMNVVIANNTIRKLRFKDSLYNASGAPFGYTGTGIINYQTDGITVLYGGSNCSIIGNLIDTVGEPVDYMAAKGRIEGNLFLNSFVGMKVVHGGNTSVWRDNTVAGAGILGVQVAGTTIAGFGNSFGNLFQGNTFTDVGKFTAYLNGAADPGFEINLQEGGSTVIGNALRIFMTAGTNGRPYNTMFFGNSIIEPADSLLLHPIIVDPNPEQYSMFYGNYYTNSSSVSRDNMFYNGRGWTSINAYSNVVYQDTNNQVTMDRNAKALIQADFNGDGRKDIFVCWGATGTNMIYSPNADNTVTVKTNPISTAGINGSPMADVYSGDFNGDGRADLMFYWKADGNNRLFKGNVDGTFTFSNNPISPQAINGSPDQVTVGDYDGNGKSDLSFIWKNYGGNRFYYGTATGFTQYVNPIATGGINENPDMILPGDFNGDGKTDLVFYWKASGQNRFRFGGVPGSFSSADNRIPTTEIEGSPNYVLVFDANNDGIDDVDFFWDAAELRQLYLGQSNKTFIAD